MNIQSQINKATTLFELIRTEAERRDGVYENRSDKWQESENGELYVDKTYLLEQFADDLENAIDYLEEYSQG